MMRSKRNGVILMILSSLFVCFGQLLWKMSSSGGVWLLIFGFGLYAVGAVMMVSAYRFGEVSTLQPILSMSYVFSILLGVIFLSEPVNLLKTTGVLIVILGVVLITVGRSS